MIRYYLPFDRLQRLRNFSERGLAHAAGLSRGVVRQLLHPTQGNLTISSIDRLAQLFDRDVEVVVTGSEILSDYSTVATAFKIERDGFDSWKIHLFDLVDEFRRTMDGRLVILPPPNSVDPRIAALSASTVRALCEEIGICAPRWATRRHFLSKPWFVSGMNSLKASALIESPLAFRANNIFVQSNFLERA